MAGGTLFIKVLPEKGSEKAIRDAVERGGAGAEESGKSSGSRFGIGFAAAAGVAIGRGLQVAARTEQSTIALTQLTGSAATARSTLAQLTDFAANTPFELQGLQRNATQLLGVGVEAEDLIPTLRSLGDTTASLGLSQDQFDSVLRAVTQSMAKGKVQQEELLQIAEAGVPIYGLLSDAIGVNETELLKMASAGELNADDVLPRLFDQMNQDYGGGLQAQSETLTGVLANLSDTIDSGLGQAVESLLPMLVELIPAAASAASAGIGVFGIGITAVTTLITPLVNVLTFLLNLIGGIPEPIATALTAFFLLNKVMGGAGLIGTLISFVTNMVAARTAIATSVRSADTLGGALGAIGTAARGAAGKAGVGALFAALGGPWGIAAAAIGFVVAEIINLADNADDAKDKISGLVGEVDFSAFGATSAKIRELNDEIARLDDEQVVPAWLGGELFSDLDEQADAARDAIADLEAQQERYNSNSADLAAQLGISVGQLERLAAAAGVDLNLLAGDDEDVARFRGELEAANAAIDNGFDPTSRLGEAMAVLSDETSTTSEKADALVQALDALTGGQVDAREAAADWAETMSGLAETLGAVDDEGNNVGVAGARAALGMDFSTQAARDAQGAFLDARDSMQQQVQAAYDSALATDGAAAAQAAAGQAAQTARDQFIATATQLGLTSDEAVALADAYGLVPGTVVTAISTPGMSQAQLDLVTVMNQLRGLPPNTPVTVTGITAEAQQRLRDLGFTVTNLPDGTVTATAQTQSAIDDLNFLTRPRTVSITPLVTQGTGGGRLPGQAVYNAEGRRLEFFAGGGMTAFGHRLTPLRADQAARVPANTWRVVGDRARGMEWFIPQNAPNTVALLQDAAAAHGMRLVQAMADGGLLGGRPTPAPVATAGPTQVIGQQVLGDQYLVDPAEQRREVRAGTQAALTAAGLTR